MSRLGLTLEHDISPAAKAAIEDLSRALRALARSRDTDHGSIVKELKRMSAELDRLTQEVEQSRDATTSAIALIQGLAQQIRDLKDDPAKLAALADELDAQQTALAGAVASDGDGGDDDGGGEDTQSGDEA